MNIEVSKKGFTITKSKTNKYLKLPFNEAQLLKDLTPYDAHADELAELLSSEIDP